MLRFIFFSLFIHLAIGALLPLLLISMQEIGASYFRFVSLLCAVMMLAALFAEPFSTLEPALAAQVSPASGKLALALMGAEILLLAAGSFGLKKWGKSYLYFAFGLGLIIVVWVSHLYPVAPHSTASANWLRALSFVGSALLLGCALCAMVTGHWYLVNRRLSIQPLRIATLLFLGAMLLRVAFVVALIAITALSAGTANSAGARSMLTLSSEGMIFWARFIIGLVGPLVFGWMIYETVKLRSTQSATGILYATLVCVFVGEAFSKFLWFFTGIPV